jgi:N-acetylglucosaminyldiphosphoundecaprenol N-acetyl-beta-D-mannosaminyltransferase
MAACIRRRRAHTLIVPGAELSAFTNGSSVNTIAMTGSVLETALPGQEPHGEILAFGTHFSRLSTAEALTAILARPADAPFAYVCTPNAVHVVNYERGEPRFRAGIDGAWLRLCDSRVVARLAALASGVQLPLALGSDLTLMMLRNGVVGPDDRVTIIGGTAEMEQRLRDKFGWQHLDRYDPPFGFIADPAEVDRCVDFVLAHPARFVFLACGAPQSEVLGLRIVERGGAVGTGLCIGASLLFATGLQARAPMVMQRAGLEWLHRLALQPRRMSQRFVKSQLPLLWLAARDRMRRS